MVKVAAGWSHIYMQKNQEEKLGSEIDHATRVKEETFIQTSRRGGDGQWGRRRFAARLQVENQGRPGSAG